jgi:hypothetical protein
VEKNMSLGWFDDLSDAEGYFADERLETSEWDALTSDLKPKVLINAYNRLYYDPRWELPTYAEATPVELIKLKKANGEMAYYLAQHLADEDRRKGLQAQGVIEAGIVKEKYLADMLMELPVPPFVIVILSPWSTEEYAGALDLARDENESVHTKVHKF